MKRRIAVSGSLVLALSALAAMGLAQSGQQAHSGQRNDGQGSSLADRLNALRQSVETESFAPAHRSGENPVRMESRGPVVRPSAGPGQAREETRERPRRPRLLSSLDPLNLLSLGGEGDAAESPQDASAPARHATPNQRLRGAAGRESLSSRTPSVAYQGGVPSVHPHHQIRRSPLAHRAEETPPTSDAEPVRSSVALGPAAASDSVTLPSLDRPVSESLAHVLPGQPQAGDQSAEEVLEAAPVEQSLEAAPVEHSLEEAKAQLTPHTPIEAVTVPSISQTEAPSESAFESTSESDSESVESPAVLESEGRYADAIADAVQEAEPVTEPVGSPAGESAWEAAPAEGDVASTAADETGSATHETDSAIRDVTSPEVAEVVAPSSSEGNSPADAKEQILSSDEAPAVAWEVAGPRQILIGREAAFEVRLRNEGEHPAERLIARIDVPGSAEIVSAEATHGVGQRVEDGATSAVLEWRIDQLASSREAVLRLRVVPRTSQPLNVQVSVRAEPRSALARVEVLEPKLKLSLEGPSDVLYGEERSYRIIVTNPGTGPAENVVVMFTPPGQEDRTAQKHVLGLLQPGQSETLDIDVAPQQAGDVAMKALASADGDLRDQAERRILVRKPELVVDARGPRTTYAGTVATYYFRVQNTGDAVAHDVDLATHLPLGAEFIRATDDRKLEPTTEKNAVMWKVGSLSPGEEFYIELKCAVNWAGDNTLEVAAEAGEGELQHAKSVTTHVVALADLKLEVGDPKGPVAVGKEAIYEVRIRNRGSNTAEQVNVAALFSEGIDPVGVEGGQHSIENGRVAFRTIESLPAGREIIFKIRAVAKEPGTHVFRAEVLCRELETKLAAEETTRFYRLDETPSPGRGGFQAAAHEESSEVR